MNRPDRTAEVTLGEGVAVIRFRGRSNAVVANILGQERDRDGRLSLWLDRRIHRPGETNWGEWHVAGAISTVLTESQPGREQRSGHT